MDKTVIDNYPHYDIYKDSGEPWLGQIPKDWNILKLKHIFYEKKHTKNMALNCGSISFGKVVKKNDDRIPHSTKSSYQEVLKGEFLINPLNLNFDLISLRIALSEIDVVVSAGYIVLKNKEVVCKEYFKYLLHRYDVAYMKLLGSGVRQTINFNNIANSLLPVPTIKEQELISAFLDKKTAQIDQAITLKQEQIAKLEEYKQIVIQNAVTKGLSPDVSMKNSGIDWIGDIPKHWGLKRLKYILSERNERSKSGEEPLLMMSQKHGLVVRADYHEKAEVALSNIDNKLVYKNDLVFNKLKAHLGVFFKSNINYKGIVSPDYAVYQCKAYIEDAKFLEVLFRNPKYIEQFIIRATGIVAGLIRLYTSELFDLYVAVPPCEEQKEILKHIEVENLKADTAVSIIQQEIDRLKEYKTILINQAVTGQIKVS